MYPLLAPSIDEMAELAEQALREIPEEFSKYVEGVALRIDEMPDRETLHRMGIGNPLRLLGLYRGLPFGYKAAGAIVHDVDMIFLYRRPIIEHWHRRGGLLKDHIRHVLVHEIGHHFGLSDDDMEQIENAPD